jgi:hypothetical protein
METRFSIERINALMGSARPREHEADMLATWVIDGILDNEDLNGPETYETWTVDYAIETYGENFRDATGVSEDVDIDGGQVRTAVAAALGMLIELEQTQEGVVLVNTDAGRVEIVASTLQAAQDDVEGMALVPLEWEQLHGGARWSQQKVGTRYAAYLIPMIDWAADDATRVAILAAEDLGVYVARDVLDDLDAAA